MSEAYPGPEHDYADEQKWTHERLEAELAALPNHLMTIGASQAKKQLDALLFELAYRDDDVQSLRGHGRESKENRPLFVLARSMDAPRSTGRHSL